MLPRDVEIDKSIATGENLRRRHGPVLAASAFESLFLVHPKPNDMLVGRQRFLHRRVHMIALPCALPPVESGQHARGGEYAGKVVRLGFRWPAWRQGRIARDIQETAFGQCDEIVTSEIFLWPGLAKSGDRRYDDARIDRRKAFVPQPFCLHLTGLKTFQHDVRSLYQFA